MLPSATRVQACYRGNVVRATLRTELAVAKSRLVAPTHQIRPLFSIGKKAVDNAGSYEGDTALTVEHYRRRRRVRVRQVRLPRAAAPLEWPFR